MFSQFADTAHRRFHSRFFDNDIKKVRKQLAPTCCALRFMFCVGAQKIADSWRRHGHGCTRGAANSHWVFKSGCSGPDDRGQRQPYVHIQRTSGARLKTLDRRQSSNAGQLHPRACIVCDDDATLDLRVRTVRYVKRSSCAIPTSHLIVQVFQGPRRGSQPTVG
jgi:hypothetical protein